MFMSRFDLLRRMPEKVSTQGDKSINENVSAFRLAQANARIGVHARGCVPTSIQRSGIIGVFVLRNTSLLSYSSMGKT